MGTFSKTHKVDDHGNVATVDPFNGHIHDEKGFTVSDYASGVGSANGVQWYIDTGAKECHLNFNLAVNAASRIYFHKDITVTATNSGSVVTGYNLCTSSANTASTVIYSSGTITSSGAIMRQLYLPDLVTGLGAGNTRGVVHYVLGANSQHMIKATPLTGTANICLNILFSDE